MKKFHLVLVCAVCVGAVFACSTAQKGKAGRSVAAAKDPCLLVGTAGSTYGAPDVDTPIASFYAGSAFNVVPATITPKARCSNLVSATGSDASYYANVIDACILTGKNQNGDTVFILSSYPSSAALRDFIYPRNTSDGKYSNDDTVSVTNSGIFASTEYKSPNSGAIGSLTSTKKVQYDSTKNTLSYLSENSATLQFHPTVDLQLEATCQPYSAN